MKMFILIAIFLLAASLLQAWEVGLLNRTYIDPSRNNRQIPTLIYHPLPASGTSQREAFPLIVFGHGWLSAVSTYSVLRDEFVSSGWIVAFPTTEGGFFPSHANFALDLEFVRLSVLAENQMADSELFASVDPFSVLMGHSMGGGASVLAAAQSSASALLTLAAAETSPSAISAASQVLMPSLTLSGATDWIAPPPNHQMPIYANLASCYKSYLSFAGVGHSDIYTTQLVFDLMAAWLAFARSSGGGELDLFSTLLEQNQSAQTGSHAGYMFPSISGAGTISWPKFPGASSYNVYRAPDPFADFTLLANTPLQSWTDQDLTQDRAFYRVTAVSP
ncbi:MAG: hypothetical protein K0B87_03205 [Candidatus Syntrophosphaera sp.]|nr:hypothetical protein [Candidatus Syntrophosphaera sp.]